MNEQTFCKMELVDVDHWVFRCTACGHIEQFEADGPFENGWNFCPGCGREIEREQ